VNTKVTYQPALGWWSDGLFDLFFDIPDAWVISGALWLPRDQKFTNKKIVRTGGYLFSGQQPFPMIASKGRDQKQKDDDIGSLLACGDYVPRFVRWKQYGAGNGYSFHWTKCCLSDWVKHGYAGCIHAVLHQDQDPRMEMLARVVYNIPHPAGVGDPTITTEFFPPAGNEQDLEPLRRVLSRWYWEPIDDTISTASV
jgi:hypothetical protein